MRWIVGLLMLGSTALTSAYAESADQSILITGASSGIGRHIAERLANEGYYVYAGARKATDIAELSAIDNVQGVRLDVTKQAQIDAVAAHIRSEGRALHGVINNAGVFVYGPLIEIDESELQFVWDVNVFGPYRVTKAMAPLLIESGGRVITIGSVAGLISGTMFGPYSMSKHAMEAFTDSLAREMAKFDVSVSLIEPGNFRSEIMKNTQRRAAQQRELGVTRYQNEYDGFAGFAKADRSQHQSPDAVADAAVHALSAEEPKRRYLVTPNQAEADMALRGVLTRAKQLNDDHAYSISEEQLQTMFDNAE